MRGLIRSQAGAGTIGCLFMVVIVALAIHAGLELGLPKLRHNSFQDRMNETFTFFSHQPEKNIRERIFQVASEFDIELKPEQVRVEITGDRLTIDVSYEKVAELTIADVQIWQKKLPFHLQRSGPY